LCLFWYEEDRPDARLRLRIERPLFAGNKPLGELEFDAFAVLIGCAETDDPRLDDRHRRWQRAKVIENGYDDIQAVMRAPVESLEETVRGLWSRVNSVRDGSIPRAEVETALRLARMRRLVSLDSNKAILSALWRRRENPWSLQNSLAADAVLSDLSPSRCPLDVWVEVYGTDPAAKSAVRGLQEELCPSVETPPVAPISPTITTEMETPTIEPEFTPAEGAPPLEPAPIVEEEPARSPGPPWAIFIDTCVVGFSYLWLFCGGLVLMLFVLGAVASFLLRRA